LSETSFYTAYGLIISSEISYPQLIPVQPAADGKADVFIRFGPVPEALEDPVAKGVLYQAKPNQFLLKLEKIARFLILDGREILIERAPEVTEDEVVLFLFNSAFGALLHQRGRDRTGRGAVRR
jgi:hypothetical protein